VPISLWRGGGVLYAECSLVGHLSVLESIVHGDQASIFVVLIPANLRRKCEGFLSHFPWDNLGSPCVWDYLTSSTLYRAVCRRIRPILISERRCRWRDRGVFSTVKWRLSWLTACVARSRHVITYSSAFARSPACFYSRLVFFALFFLPATSQLGRTLILLPAFVPSVCSLPLTEGIDSAL